MCWGHDSYVMVIMNTVNKDKLTGREQRQNIALHVLALQIKLLKCCLLNSCITIRIDLPDLPTPPCPSKTIW